MLSSDDVIASSMMMVLPLALLTGTEPELIGKLGNDIITINPNDVIITGSKLLLLHPMQVTDCLNK